MDWMTLIVAITGGVIAAGISSWCAYLIAKKNNTHQLDQNRLTREWQEKQEFEKWVRDKKMRVYSDFIGNALELMTSLKDVYEGNRFEDKRYRNLLRKLRMADILILGSDEVMESYETVILALTTFYDFVKDDQMLADKDGLQGHLITVSLGLRSLEGMFRKDIGLNPSKSNILNYPVM
ncbi:hypothetical protein [Glutamicibacter ardleyensis]|uniref:hypothetical protein n=1 Tax=Glutamicibacter ardleyensis TaxID=225894 RepID=UPI003FCF36DB